MIPGIIILAFFLGLLDLLTGRHFAAKSFSELFSLVMAVALVCWLVSLLMR